MPVAVLDYRTAVRRPGLAFVFAVPIAVLGGLIGLGGAEFRLPVLAGPLRYSARQAVPLNLAVSLVTLVTALVTRAGSLTLDPLAPFLPAVAAMIVGAAITAFAGPSIAGRLSNAWLDRVILVLLVGIGVALIVESFLPDATVSLVPRDLWPVAAFALGLGIGLVSSLLGVAGGELIIPSFVFAFGAPIKVAGSLSLLVSIPTVVIGIARYARSGSYADRSALRDTVAPMGVGSVIGAVIGGLLVGLVSPAVLKLALGLILIGSALRVFSHRQAG